MKKTTKILTCISCSTKYCEKSENGTFDICPYGISYLKQNDEVETKEPKVPLSSIAKNLRHEINPILQLIIQQTTLLDQSLSTKKIDLDNPLSVIIGSTVILDNFIQMITGVHEFHSLPSIDNSRKINLKKTIDTYFNTYSIIKEESRTKNLTLINNIDDSYDINKCSDYIKYIIAVLIDNAWKYSEDNSKLIIKIARLRDNLYQIKFTNKSKLLPEDFDLFEMGTKLDSKSKGFGYGLSWVKTLESNYNNLVNNNTSNQFKISHNQLIPKDKSNAFQEFLIDNVIIEKNEERNNQ